MHVLLCSLAGVILLGAGGVAACLLVCRRRGRRTGELFRLMPVSMLLFDGEGRLLFRQVTTREEHGFPVPDFEDTAMLEKEAGINLRYTIDDVLLTGHPRLAELRFEGRQWRLRFSGVDPNVFGKPAVAMAAVDITEHLQLEEERDRLHEQLEGYVNLERTVNRCLEALIPDSGTADVTDEVMRIVSTHELGDACGIYRLEAGEGRAVLEYGWQAAGSGNAAKLPEHLELAPGGDWLERMEKGEVVRGGVLSSSDPVLRQLCTGAAGRPGFRSALASGIRVSERLDGFAVLLFRGGEEVLNKMEDRAIVAISRILSLAAEKRRSLEQLKRSEREKSMIIDHIDTAIMLLDGREHLIKVNPAAAAIAGKSEAELLAEPCYQNFCGCGPDFDKCPVSESFRTRRPAVLDVEIGGRSYIASAVPVLDDDGEIINVIHTLVDVTNRKETEAKIRGSLKEAEVANRAKSTFLATMSHEIRTPLNAIIGFSEILKNEGLPAEALESVEAINAAGESLLALINDVLEISKIDADKLEIIYGWIRLETVLGDVGRIFEPQLRQKQLALRMEIPSSLPEFHFSASRLRQILYNLLGNAVKFTVSGAVTVTAAVRKGTGNRAELEIAVTDTGSGITPEDQKKIFEPFVQSRTGDAGGDASEGTGLGLAIVRRLAEKMNGEVLLESEPGRGSRFRIVFSGVEYRETESVAALPVVSAEEFPAGERQLDEVWVVDDVVMNRKVMLSMFRALKLNCVVFDGAAEALARLQAGDRPKAVFSDIWMPNMNGCEFAVEVRKIPGCETMPFVAVTADTEAQCNFDLSSFDQLLLKPITLEKLDKILNLVKVER